MNCYRSFINYALELLSQTADAVAKMRSLTNKAESVYYNLTQCYNQLETDISTVISYNTSAYVVSVS